jgi:serine/threonine protein kinase
MLALKEMHKFNIIHRDLKPENLFFDSLELTTSWVYIADFDRSK